MRAANAEMLATYWAIGQEILQRQDQEGYGTKVIDRLSHDLKKRFAGARGYSAQNLKYMRAFAAAWPKPIIAELEAELSTDPADNPTPE